MSKIFATADTGSDRVVLGTPSALNNVGGVPSGSAGQRTFFSWIYMIAFNAVHGAGRYFDKFSGTAGWLVAENNGTGVTSPVKSFQFNLAGSTNGRAAAVDNTLALNTWFAIAGTYKPSDGGPRLFLGSLSSPMAEVTYSTLSGVTRRDAIGATTDAAVSAVLGNNAAAIRAPGARISHPAIFDNALTVAQLERLRAISAFAVAHRFATAAAVPITCVGYWPFWESAAATALDLSGNHNNGTVTGTTVGQDCVLPLGRAALLVA